MNKKLSYLACATLFGAMLVSCTNDLNVPTKGNPDLNGTLSPVVAPDLITYSGNQVLFNSFNGTSVSTRAEEYAHTEGPISWTADLDGTVTSNLVKEEESKFFDEKLPEKHVSVLEKDINWDFLYFAKETLEFEMYIVSANTSFKNGKNSLGIFYFDKSGNIQEIEDVMVLDTQTQYNASLPGIKIKVEKGYKFGFFWLGTHKVNVEYPYGTYPEYQEVRFYSSCSLNPLSFVTTGEGGDTDFEPTNIRAVTFYDNIYNPSKTYIGFEDWTDFDYQDWGFTCDKILKTVKSDNTEWGKDDEGNVIEDPNDKVCPECGHKGHDHQIDDCEECAKNGPAEGAQGPCKKDEGGNTGGTVTPNPNPTPNPTPNPNPNGKYENNEVEINLSINDIHTLPGGGNKYGLADLVSKLSIHVRYPHDVEVILPVPEQIYCDQDDLYILKDHYFDENGDPNWKYGGESVTWTSFVDDNTVTLTVEYVPAGEDRLTNPNGIAIGDDNFGCGYIRVYTEGINKAVIDYCRKNFGDGINFEVYNYYNRGNQYTTGSYASITAEELQYYFLSRSMVNFDWNWNTKPHDNVTVRTYPDFYINAFHKDLDGNPVKGDCYMWILGDNHAKCNDHSLYLDNPSIKGSGSFTWKHLDQTTECQRNNFFNPYQGEHFNGSPFNWIYTSKSVTGGINSDDMTSASVPALWPFAKEANESNDAPYQYFKMGGEYLYNFKPNN